AAPFEALLRSFSQRLIHPENRSLYDSSCFLQQLVLEFAGQSVIRILLILVDRRWRSQQLSNLRLCQSIEWLLSIYPIDELNSVVVRAIPLSIDFKLQLISSMHA